MTDKPKPHSYKAAIIRLRETAQRGMESAIAHQAAEIAASATFKDFPSRQNDSRQAELAANYASGERDALGRMLEFIDAELESLAPSPKPEGGNDGEG